MLHKLILFFFLTSLAAPTFAQTVVTGIIIDSETKRPLSYVNIGIKNKNIGTSSLHNGSFTILIPIQNTNDTLTFSIVGYSQINVPLKDIIVADQKVFHLTQMPTELSTVTITAKALVEKKFGIKSDNALIHFTDGSINQDDIFEIAQLVKFGTGLAKITSVSLLINSPRKDSATFRINFYRHDDDNPGVRVIEKSIIQTKQIDQGWLKFDLSNFNIQIKGDFVVAIEFIPSPHKTTPIYYEVKLGGSAKSYVRTSSQGRWKRPPHHYRMYVTALVEDKNRNKHPEIELDDDLETAPAKIIFSNFVNDRFSIFVKLPENYNAKRRKGYKVAYLLDGNAYFNVIADEVRKQKKEVILVGIGYGDAYLMDSLRNRDYTFPQASVEDSFAISGGAKQFLDFLEFELIPFVDKTYRTDSTHRTLMGHSLGGYFTIFAMEQGLLHSGNLFSNYVSASPSLYYGDQFLIKTLQNTGPGNSNVKTLFLTVGENELNEDPSTQECFDSFIKLTNGQKFESVKLTTEIFPKFGHMDTAIPTFVRAIQNIK
jgi:predicted alpha/beta superfamily hydrolase